MPKQRSIVEVISSRVRVSFTITILAISLFLITIFYGISIGEKGDNGSKSPQLKNAMDILENQKQEEFNKKSAQPTLPAPTRNPNNNTGENNRLNPEHLLSDFPDKLKTQLGFDASLNCPGDLCACIPLLEQIGDELKNAGEKAEGDMRIREDIRIVAGKALKLYAILPYGYAAELYEECGSANKKKTFDMPEPQVNVENDTQNKKERPGALLVIPANNFNSTGPACNGNFEPASIDYILKNTGKEPIDFSVTKDVDWVDLSQIYGTLGPGEMTAVIATLNEGTKKLAEGDYNGKFDFINTTNGKGNAIRLMDLDVSEEQCWRVWISGYEAIQINRSNLIIDNKFAITKYGMRFNYKLIVDFTVKKKKGKWTYKDGRITEAQIGYGSLYDNSVWSTYNLKCLNCSKVTSLKGTRISGNISSDNYVSLLWKDIRPAIEIDAKVKLPCKPESECKVGTAYYESEKYFGWMNDYDLPLTDGYSKQFRPKDLDLNKVEKKVGTWDLLQHDYVLKRLK